MAKRAPAFETVDGEECARVPLDKKGKHGRALLLKSDFENLQTRRFSTNWRLSGDNVIVSQAGNDNTTIAKAIMDPPDGYRVHFKNGNQRDLRRRNLELVLGKASRRPRISQHRIRRARLDPKRIKVVDRNETELDQLLRDDPDKPVNDELTISAGDVRQDNGRVHEVEKVGYVEGVARGHLIEQGKILITDWIADKNHPLGLPAPQYSMSSKSARKRFGYSVKRFGVRR